MKRLFQMIAADAVPHALLLVGRGGAEAAEAFVKKLGVAKTDLHLYHPEGKSDQHPITSIRKLIEDVSFLPYQGRWKVFVLHEAEKMLPTSGNALLKTLEEPTPNTVILLLTNHPEKLLLTIRSRCQTLYFSTTEEIDREPILAYLAGKKSPESLEEIDHEVLLETILLWHRDRTLLTLDGGEKYLSFPDQKEAIQKVPYIPLEHVTKTLAQAQLALSRSLALPHVLDMLSLSLK